MTSANNFPKILAIGFAMFSMFFGAGNIVFPIEVGERTLSMAPYAMLGLLVTAVMMPVAGLMAMMLFQGNYHRFFHRVGKAPGAILIVLILALIGPFGAIPRCITLSFSTFQMFFTNINPIAFFIISSVIIYLLTFRESKIVEVLGKYLTPFLLLSLATLIIKGLFSPAETTPSDLTTTKAVSLGFQEGFLTMDLLAALFFSPVILASFKGDYDLESKQGRSQMLRTSLQASLIGGGLLALVYVGFMLIAASHSEAIATLSLGQLVGGLAKVILGDAAGLIASASVALACLTTAVALTAIMGEFIRDELTGGKVSYRQGLIISLVVTFLVNLMDFEGIIAFLVPVMRISYPALIVLSLCNMLERIWGFPYVKAPFYVTLGLSILFYVI